MKLLIPLVFVAASIFAQPPCPRTFRVAEPLSNETAQMMTAGDFDEDGRNDLVFTTIHGELWILLHRGNDVYEPRHAARVQPLDYRARLHALELNNDGHLDVAYQTWYVVITLLGRGDGTFEAPVTTRFARMVEQTDMADLNGDGLADSIGADRRELIVLAGDAEGRFREASAIPFYSGLWDRAPFETGDFDGDGRVDAVSAGADPISGVPFVHYAWNEGNFQFKFSISTRIAAPIDGIALADLDNDGAMEVIGRGNGVLVIVSARGRTITSRAVPYIGSLANFASEGSGDFDGDGYVDIAFRRPLRGVAIAWGKADPAAPFATSAFDAPGERKLLVADLNGDGVSDLVTSGQHGLSAIHGARGVRDLFAARLSPTSVSLEAGYAIDIDGDGRRDFIGADRHDYRTYLFAGDGSGGFAERPGFLPFHAGAVGDFDGDGYADIAVRKLGTIITAVKVLFGNGTWSFVEGDDIAPGEIAGTVRVDGRDALLFRSNAVVHVAEISSGRSAKVTQLMAYDYNYGISAVDLDRDGDADIVHDRTVFLRMGGGWQQAELLHPVFDPYLTAADMNGDGLTDLVSYGSNFVILLAKGDGTYTRVDTNRNVGAASSDSFVDIDRDGLVDVIDHTHISRNTGGGLMTSCGNSFPSDAALHSMFVEDFDGDGWPDAGALSSAGVVALRNIPGRSRLRAVALPAAAAEGTPVELMIRGLGDVFGGMTRIFHGMALLHTEETGRAFRFATVRYTLPRLPPGSHIFTVTFTAYGSTSRETVMVRILPGGKRRAVH
jgi:FG-GAP-like repeat